MYSPKAGFHSREEKQRELALTGQYRQIGIKAVVSANIAARPSHQPKQMQAGTGASTSQSQQQA